MISRSRILIQKKNSSRIWQLKMHQSDVLAARSTSWLLIVCNLEEPKNQDALILCFTQGEQGRWSGITVDICWGYSAAAAYYFFKLCLQCNSPHHFNGWGECIDVTPVPSLCLSLLQIPAIVNCHLFQSPANNLKISFLSRTMLLYGCECLWLSRF